MVADRNRRVQSLSSFLEESEIEAMPQQL